MSDNNGLDIDALVSHDTSQVLNHGLSLFITTNALYLAG
jgi:hypothetical protein